LTKKQTGASLRRRHGDRYLVGNGGYFDDLDFPGTLHAAILRSPHAAARIVGVDTASAERAHGVRVLLTGAQASALTRPIPQAMNPASMGGNVVDVRCMAVDEVLYEGQGVAAVAADTLVDAVRALDLIEVRYETLAPVLDAETALAPTTRCVYRHWPDNVVMKQRFRSGDVDAALLVAKYVLEDSIDIQRTATTPIETRGYLADWDPRQERLTFVGTTQNPHPERWILSTTLGLREEQIRVIASNLGGAFGAKMRAQPESVVVALLSRLACKPVKWIEDRSLSFLQGAREQRHRFTVGFESEGRVTALRVEATTDVGVVSASPGWGMSFITALTFPTGYQVPNLDVQVTAAATNKPPWIAARGFGKESTNLVMERVMDLIARNLNVDPIEIRRRNLVARHQFPYRTATGLRLDSGDYHGALDRIQEAIGYRRARLEQAEARAAGRLFGVGIAFELTPEAADIPGTLTGGFDTSTVRVSPSGMVTVLTGVTSPGGGSDTAILQVVGDQLGLPAEEITLIQGDTDCCPYGFGNFSSRATLVGASSAALAADDVRAKMAVVAAAMLDDSPESLNFEAGRVAGSRGGSVSFAEIANAVYTRAFDVAKNIEPPLEATRSYRPGNIDHTPDDQGRIQPYPTYSYAVHASVVEVDRETGIVHPLRHAVVHDCGTMINPALVEGQMLGAISMGLGMALSEEILYSADGRLMTDSFKTYLLNRAADIPPISIVHLVTPSPFTLLGTKGAGEAGVGGAQAAIVSAVDDAIQPTGARVTRLPLRPPEILRRLHAAASR
jgi:aerobic carbon-monoxide dehydrogenase large subunit